MPFPYIGLSSFQVSCKNVNRIKKNVLTLRGGGEGRAAQPCGLTFCVCWRQLQINVSTKNEGNDQKEVSLFSTNMIKTVVKLYLFIENKELSFNVGL